MPKFNLKISKTKYRFNPETLAFEKINKSLKQKLYKTLKYVCSSVFFSFIIYFLYAFCIDTPKVKHFKKENNQLIVQYEILNNKINEIDSIFKGVQEKDDNIYRTIFSLEPLPSTIRDAGFGGINKYHKLEGYDNSEIVLKTAKKIDKLLTQLYIQENSYEEVMNMACLNIKKLRCIPAIQPIENKDLKRIASGYGIRYHPILRIRKMHKGMDFTAPRGTEVYATGYGVVKEVKYSRRGYGNMIVIDHGYGYETVYAHLRKIFIEEGSKVKRGQIIASVGNSGFSTGPHLHYEIHKHSIPVNPVNYYFNDLTPEQFLEVKRMSELDITPFD